MLQMIPTIIRLSDINDNIPFPKCLYSVTCGRGDDQFSYLELFCGFDIETTNFEQVDGWFGYAYHFQFSVATQRECFVYLSRTWEVFLHFLETFIKHYSLGKYTRVICGVANLGFEFQYIRKRLQWDEDEYSFFAKEEREPLKATYHGVEFREVLTISGGNLAFLARTYCKTQKLVTIAEDGSKISDLDYSIIRSSATPLTSREEAYCINDVVIISEFMQYIFDTYVRPHKKMPMTKTSVLMDKYKRNLDKMCRERDSKNHLEALSSYREYKDYLFRCFPDITTYQLWFKYLFRGGYVHANALYMDVDVYVKMRDITSHYPTRMNLGYYPVTPFIKINRDDFTEDLLNKKCCILHVVFDFISATTSHAIESKNKCVNVFNGKWDNGRLVSADYLEVYLTEMDYKIYQLFYKTEIPPTILEVWTAEKGKLPPYLMDVLNDSYKRKNELKKQGLNESQEYAILKGEVNSNYGALCRRIRLDRVAYKNNEWTTDPIRPNYIEEARKQNLLPQWGIWVTSAARYELLTMLYRLTKAGVEVVYMDTDSIKYVPSHKAEQIFKHYNNTIRKHLHNRKLRNVAFSDLGFFDREEKGKTVRFKTLGAKRYIYESGGKVKATVAGMPKISINNLGQTTDEIFANFTSFGYVLKPDVSGKLTTRYRDSAHSAIIGRLPYGVEMREESSVALYQIPFTLKIKDDYINYCEELQSEREVL